MKIQINLGLSLKTNSEILVDGGQYVTCMNLNPYFLAAAIVAQVATTKAAIIAFHAVLNAPTSDTKTDDIKVARDVAEREITALALMVQTVANDASLPDIQRPVIVASAGMQDKVKTPRGKQKFTAHNTVISGTTHLTAQGKADANDWAYSLDTVGFTNRVVVDTTTAAHTDIPGLPVGTEVAFFHKAVIAGVTTAWEGPIFLKIA